MYKHIYFNKTNITFTINIPVPPALYISSLSLQLHDRLDNERTMEGQLLPFISFTVHNFYFIQSERIANF